MDPETTEAAAVASEAQEVASEAREVAVEASNVASEATGVAIEVAEAVERQEAAEQTAEMMADAFAASETARRIAAMEERISEWLGGENGGERLASRVLELEALAASQAETITALLLRLDNLSLSSPTPQTVTLETGETSSTPQASGAVLEVDPTALPVNPLANDAGDPPVVEVPAKRKRGLKLV